MSPETPASLTSSLGAHPFSKDFKKLDPPPGTMRFNKQLRYSGIQ